MDKEYPGYYRCKKCNAIVFKSLLRINAGLFDLCEYCGIDQLHAELEQARKWARAWKTQARYWRETFSPSWDRIPKWNLESGHYNVDLHPEDW